MIASRVNEPPRRPAGIRECRVLIAGAVVLLAAAAGMRVDAQQPPLAPQSLTFTVSGNLVTLQWVLNPQGEPATIIRIQAGSASGLSDLAVIDLAAPSTSTAAAAPPGTYFVRVVALNAFGASAPSNEIIVTVGGGCPLPGVPTGLAAVPGPGRVTITWNAPTTGGAPTGYGLLAGSVSGNANLGTFPLGPGTSFNSAAPAGQYFIRIFAVNACGNSAPSSEISFVVASAQLIWPAGIYDGTMSNHTNVLPGRPPITAFVLQLNQQVPTGAFFQLISAVWQDNAGCRQSSGIFGGTTSLGPTVSVEGLRCNSDGRDMSLRITSISGNIYTGVCPLGGANCTFRMVRR